MCSSDLCVVNVNGDVVAGQEQWKNFVEQAQAGQPASVRLVYYYTLTNRESYDSFTFEDIFKEYPYMEIRDLHYDGSQYTYRIYDHGSLYESVWDYMTLYSAASLNDMTYGDYCLFSNMPDPTWEEYLASKYLSSTPFLGYIVYSDIIYDRTPTLGELEAAKNALEPYMIE